MIPLHYEMLQCVVQLLSRVQPCETINCSMPGFPVPHCQPEFAKLMSWLGEVSITSDMQMTPPSWQKVRRTKEPLDESKRGE